MAANRSGSAQRLFGWVALLLMPVSVWAASWNILLVGLRDDPRQREASNPKLLTAEPAHDVVMVLDAVGEFAKALPYNTALPRPVVGSGGLVPLAWHPSWERTVRHN